MAWEWVHFQQLFIFGGPFFWRLPTHHLFCYRTHVLHRKKLTTHVYSHYSLSLYYSQVQFKGDILNTEYKIVLSVCNIELFCRQINEKLICSCGWLPCTPLRIAAMMGHSECVVYLISQGAAVDLVDVKGQTALYMAVVNGHLECVKILLKAGADPNGSIHHRSTPIYHAAQVGRADILLELIRWGNI